MPFTEGCPEICTGGQYLQGGLQCADCPATVTYCDPQSAILIPAPGESTRPFFFFFFFFFDAVTVTRILSYSRFAQPRMR